MGNAPTLYIGIMSGTSLDGIDSALIGLDDGAPRQLGSLHLPFDQELRATLLELNTAGDNELERAALAANRLSHAYAVSVRQLLQAAQCSAHNIRAIGCHGQTVRHRPDLGYTLQLVNSALLAELSGIAVVSDFRSRDIAAGGQGAPLAPAFHAALFKHPEIHRVIVNIGGISNLTDLPVQGKITGFDCGPGNVLLDAWTNRHLGQAFDRDGAWADSGRPIPELLEQMLADPYFSAPPPKSTGRDLFNPAWLQQYLPPSHAPADIQATLLALTARGIADAIRTHCPGTQEIYLCGGGAHNRALVSRLQQLLPNASVDMTDKLGISSDWVEALAFAWLAQQTLEGKPGNLPEVTGARGMRLLGAIHPAG
ncbi:MAG: anhydro-N-acetylmuramic acid kinase [Sulfuricellaceae bacterium]